MKKYVVVMASLVMCLYAQSQDIKYDTASIPATLKKGANVIKRYENIVFEVADIDKAVLKTHQVYTILNSRGNRYLVFNEYVDKFVGLDNVDIRVFDVNGKQVNKYKQKDLMMHAVSDGLIDDNKGYGLMIPASSYPITVEYKYEQRYRGTLFYPIYHIMGPEVAVEQSTFAARVPKDLNIRYKAKSIALAPVITDEEKYKVYQWSVKNLKPKEAEDGAATRFPEIVLAPNRFQYDDFQGDLSSWKNFGVWYGNLNKGLDVLPPERVAFFNELVKDAPNDQEKMRRIYQYMQKNFRYVSIQLGIGGLRTFSAAFTDQKKYGDCKALSNYMKAVLKAVGIKSYVAVINAGANNSMTMDADFPSPFANHVILCVPGAKDTVWLECTSNISDFGVLGNFTENRNALLITEDGGVLVPTPLSKYADNVSDITTTISLNENGSGKSTTVFNTRGEFKEMMRGILDMKKDDQKEAIVYSLEFKQPDEFALTKQENTAQQAVALDMALEKIPEFIAGNKMFVSPRLYKIWSNKLPKAENRTQDYCFSFPFDHADTTIFKLPAGFSVDALPQVKTLSCKEATYTSKCWYNEEQRAIYSTARLTLKQHTIPATDYTDVKKFFDAVQMDDAQRIVIRKN
jgi:hypothetical protein